MMTKKQDIHPALVRSMQTTIDVLEAGIELRRAEIEDMQRAIEACQTVATDEISIGIQRVELEANLADKVGVAIRDRT